MPERLRYLEHPGAGHWMTRAAWELTALETVGWLDRFVAAPPSTGSARADLTRGGR
jgi:hypothetical protein